jgi:hypothetical protein
MSQFTLTSLNQDIPELILTMYYWFTYNITGSSLLQIKLTALYLNIIKLQSSVFHRRSDHLITYPNHDLSDQLFGTGSHIAEITLIRKHGSHCRKCLRM